jgi:hypothetical protein
MYSFKRDLIELIRQNIGGKTGEIEGSGVELCTLLLVENGNSAKTIPTRNDRDDDLRGYALFP